MNTFLKVLPLLLFIVVLEAKAAQVFVVSPKAVIYADQELKAPIGFVRLGRKLIVGSTPRKNRTILPIIVSSKIAYIKISDLNVRYTMGKAEEYTSSPKIREHHVEEFHEERMERIGRDPVAENNYLFFNYNAVAFGGDWEKVSSSEYKTASAAAFKLMIEHHPPMRSFHWGVGFGYYTYSEDNVGFNMPTAEILFMWSPIRSSLVSLDFYFRPIISIDFRIKTIYFDGNENKDEINQAQAYGGQFGLQLRFFSQNKFGFAVGANMQSLQLSGFDKEYPHFNLQKFQNSSIYGGVTYHF